VQAIRIPPSYDLHDLTVVEVPDPPPPPPGNVLLAMQAVSLNYRDLMVARGHDRWRPPVGRIPVSDGVGIVSAIGPDVDRLTLGQRVMTTILPRWISGPMTRDKLEGSLGGRARDGVLATRVILPAESVVPVPDDLTDVEAACLPCAGVTAWHAVTRAGSLRPDATVLVQGTGGVALFAVQLLLAAGARVIATSSSDDKLAKLHRLGVRDTINYRTTPNWDVEVLRLTAGRGVDHVIDIGGAGSLARSMSAVAVEGVVSMIGVIGGLKAEIDIGMAFDKNLRLDGVETGSRAMLEELLAFVMAHRVKPVVDRVFSLVAARDAFLRLESGGHFGKVCIVLDVQ
jgi:NADPH:quinone reductase-like Zn-dependent oxidoreductase